MSHIDACTAVADVQQRCKIQGPAPTSNSETQRQHHLLQRVGYMTTHSVIEACWLRKSRCVIATRGRQCRAQYASAITYRSDSAKLCVPCSDLSRSPPFCCLLRASGQHAFLPGAAVGRRLPP